MSGKDMKSLRRNAMFLLAIVLIAWKIFLIPWPDSVASWILYLFLLVGVSGLIVVILMDMVGGIVGEISAYCVDHLEKKLETQAVPEEFWELLLWAAERGKFCKRDLADAFGLGKKVAGEIGKLMATFCTHNGGPHPTELEFAFSKEDVLKMKRNWQFHCLTSSSMREKLWEVRDFDEWLAPLTLLEKEESDKFSDIRRLDEKFWDVALWAAKKGQFSISEVQSSFKMGFSRASRLVDQMERVGICGKAKGDSEPRDILMGPEEVASLKEKWEDEELEKWEDEEF